MYVSGESQEFLRGCRQRWRRPAVGACFVDAFAYKPVAHYDVEAFCGSFGKLNFWHSCVYFLEGNR